MRIERVKVEPKPPLVPFVLGGVYEFRQTGCLYLLTERRGGGVQLAGVSKGVVLEEGPFDTDTGVNHYLNDGRWRYVHDAKLVVPE